MSSDSDGNPIGRSIRDYFANKHIKIRPFNQNDIDSMIASALSGMFATMSGHPFDSVKVRMQMSASKKSIFHTVYSIVQKEGIVPFYRGIVPPTATKAFTTMIFFTTNSYLKENIIENKRRKYLEQGKPVPDKIVLSLTETTAVAAFCGLLLCPFISTAELIKIQLQTDKTIAGRPPTYDNMLHCTRKVIEYRQLHRGMAATALRLIPGWGTYLLVYDAFNRHWDKHGALGNNETLGSLNVTLRVLTAGTLAGWASWVASYPFDYMKTQIQAHPITRWNYLHTKIKVAHQPRVRDVISVTMESRGLRGFYRGLMPCLLRSFPVNMTNFWVYETVISLRRKYRSD